VGRRPSVFVRSVSMEEGRRLQRVSRTSNDPVRLRRAIVVLMSAQGQTAKDITSLMQVSEDYVRDVIHAFNERGFDALDPKWSGGRPKGISERVREHIRLIARTSPADWGITGFATWSLDKLAHHLTERHVVPRISRETLRRILRAPGRQAPPPAGDLQPLRRGDAHARRPRPGHGQGLLPDPRAQTVARVPRPAQGPARALAWGEALHRAR
jgi:transposase